MNHYKRSYPQYPEYKSSNVEWIEQIPKHWDIWKTTHGFNTIGSGTTPKSDNSEYYDGEINWVTTSELRENEIFESRQKITKLALEDYSALSLYPPDSIIIAMYGATIGRLGVLKNHSTVNQACCVFSEPKTFHGKFFFYWLQYRKSILISLSVGGGQPNLSQDDLKSLRVPLPPLPEQKAIASFLDHQTNRIDQLIEKKKRLLELLDEQRQAIITNAVTKGINPDASMKDSGIDWLGDVPENWDVEKLKYFVQLNSREIEFDDGKEIVKVALENIESGTGKLIYEEDDKSFQGKGNPFSNGDILFNKLRPYLAKVIHAEFKGVAVGELLVLTPDKSGLNSKYLFYRLLSNQFIKIVNNSTYGAKMPRANWDFVGNLRIGIPPLKEQLEIGSYLDQRINQFDQLKTKIQRAINKLEEYRSSLITQAVTGKIDVRDTIQEVEMSYAAEEGELYMTNE